MGNRGSTITNQVANRFNVLPVPYRNKLTEMAVEQRYSNVDEKPISQNNEVKSLTTQSEPISR